jgi:hypothetical protein
MSTVFLWLHAHPEFSERYAHAQLDRAAAMAEDIIEISDNGDNDYRQAKNG